MNIMKFAAALVFAAIAFALDAAPAAKGEVVAEGYPSWNGVADKNYLRGRMISVSDLRHRALIVIELDPADPKLIEQLPMFSRLASFDPLASSHGIIWENYVLPRDMLILISFRGKRNEKTDENIKTALAAKGLAADLQKSLTALKSQSVAMYYNVELAESPVNTERKFPFVYVMGPEGKEPIWSGAFSDGSSADAVAAFRKARASAKALDWNLMTGVKDLEKFPAVKKAIDSGKPMSTVYAQLRQTIKGSDPELAKEAQKLYDALEQYRSDLMLRIRMELAHAPARAYMDAETLFKYYPKEKKKLADVQARLKANREAAQLGKIFTSFMKWSDPEYSAKKSEIKKNIQEINKWKKILTKLESHPNAALSGEAALVNSQLDMLIDTLNAKMEADVK